jgi:hypothetical protein
MLTLIAAAAIAAQTPPAPPPPTTQHAHQMKMGEHAQHQGMDCCKHCCDDMDAKQDAHGADHAEHGGK